MNKKHVQRNRKCTVTMSDIEYMQQEYMGMCVSCGEWHESLEPDARECHCESCGKDTVYGAEEMVIQQLVDIRW
jgi:Zn finger protein HypA/HybF involved in hydrogenase expression